MTGVHHEQKILTKNWTLAYDCSVHVDSIVPAYQMRPQVRCSFWRSEKGSSVGAEGRRN